MQRAVIAIGVKKTGQLPELQAAVESATQFAAWAKGLQKIPASRVELITDAKGAVSRDRIFETVDRMTQLGFIEQLIVYFSGHGINSGLVEQWLLSRAPDDPAAAVNVKGSEFGARFCGIGHVVFISDACRTAADSIQAQRVAGGDIFPNAKPSGPEKPVDQFFATLVGNPAFEVKTVQESTSRYVAGYSTVLMEALRGEVPALNEPASGGRLIRPRPLKRHLSTAVPSFFTKINPAGTVSAQPDARIESEPDAWIAELPPAAAAPADAAAAGPKRRRPGRGRGKTIGGEAALPPLAVEQRAAPSLEREASLALRAALVPSAASRRLRAGPQADRGGRARRTNETRRRYDALVSSGLTVFGPDALVSKCGIKVRGARIESVYSRHAATSVGPANNVIQVELEGGRRGANVLARVADGSAVIVPAFRDFITGLSFDADGALEDVWCEPSANTARWRDAERGVDEVRELRAVIAASSALGIFRLDEEDGSDLLQRMLRVKSVDPALAVYAAHALHDRRMRSRIVDLQRYLDRDLGVRIFDVAMLAFSLGRQAGGDEPREMYPCVPMLTQGWALLSPLDLALPAGLGELRGELRPSLWTHFAAGAADRLHHALSQGKVE